MLLQRTHQNRAGNFVGVIERGSLGPISLADWLHKIQLIALECHQFPDRGQGSVFAGDDRPKLF
jgi:hypothetical protein